MNFRNIGDAFSGDRNTRKPNADPNYSLSRQPSVYALTFDEFRNTWGSLGKDFGSMNMDELLKSIGTAEESHAMASSNATAAAVAKGSIICGNLQRQGSLTLTLPRTLSQKTVDEVWKDLFKESIGAKDGSGGETVTSLPRRQRTLGEMTLEEFLARAGVVREDAPKIGDVNDGAAAYEDLSKLNNNNNNNVAASSALAPLRFQQMNQNNGLRFGVNNKFSLSQTPPSLALDVGGGVRSLQPPQPQQQFSKAAAAAAAAAATMAFAAPLHLPDTTQMAVSKRKLGVLDQSINFSMVRSGGVQNRGISGVTVASLGGAGGVVVLVGSSANPISPNLVPKSSMEQSSVSPVPYQFERGRKPNGTLEKVVERRQRRMIKNRESAARSRARKQAYTLELEAELATLKELNQELHQKEGVHDKMQKHRTVNGHWGRMRLRLRRTMTEPW